MNVLQFPMCAKSYTVGPQQYMPTLLAAGSSGTKSCTARDNVLKSFKAISDCRGRLKPAVRKKSGFSQSQSQRATRLQHEMPLLRRQMLPVPGRELSQLEPADTNANQPQRRVANRSRHATDLAILALCELQSQPT